MTINIFSNIEQSELYCAQALSTLSFNVKCVESVVKQQALEILVLLTASKSSETAESCVRAICNLSQLVFTRVKLVEIRKRTNDRLQIYRMYKLIKC